MKNSIKKQMMFILLILVISCEIKENSDVFPSVSIEVENNKVIRIDYYENKKDSFILVNIGHDFKNEEKFIDSYTSLVEECSRYWNFVSIDHITLKGSQYSKKDKIDKLLSALRKKLKKDITLKEYDDKGFVFVIND
ncbi:MAG: hypothetical protein IT220_03595 [Flavobacteriaceae bacterium]|nr:hypothetical protein [Flavobacteriaceae bacterium]